MRDDRLAAAFIYGIGAAVTIAWFISVIADVVSASYSTPVALYGLEGTIVGSVFGLRHVRRRGLGDKEDEE